MSCVAELNASNQKTAKVSWKKCSVGMVKAMPASPVIGTDEQLHADDPPAFRLDKINERAP